MAGLKTKEGVLTPSDLARYGIPPKQQPSHDPNLEVSEEAEKKAYQLAKHTGGDQ
jgi:hypothetical protein